MKKFIAFAFVGMVFAAGSASAADGGGLADRFNEERSYPTHPSDGK